MSIEPEKDGYTFQAVGCIATTDDLADRETLLAELRMMRLSCARLAEQATRPIPLDEIATALWPPQGAPESWEMWFATAERCNGAGIALLRMGEYGAAHDVTMLALVASERAMMTLATQHG